jgi:hypothetical protein
MNENEYFDWLVDQIGGRHRFGLLLSYLYDTEFVWTHKAPTDANRAKDGQDLRSRYANETGDYISYKDSKHPCRVLEMMIALSTRIENDIMGEPGNDHPERWFWEMIKNLGLFHLSDSRFDEGTAARVLRKWMDRDISPKGAGGLFPLQHTSRDQRLIPIWDQMNEYLNEEYWKEN